MPSRKQRRRRQKLQRHEYEYVVETEEGEIPLDEVRDAEKPGQARKDGRAQDPVDRRGRPIPKPSLERVLKRSAIFGPLLLVVVFLTAPASATMAQNVFQALVLLAFFMPFSYLVDVLVYRAMVRRQRRRT
jgi:hypothetical protein